MRPTIHLVLHIIIIYNFENIKVESSQVNYSDNSSRNNTNSNNNNSDNNNFNNNSINRNISKSTSQTSETQTGVHLSASDIAQRLAQSHFEFTLKLFRAIAKEASPQVNIVFSPLLVSTLLTPTLLSTKEYANFISNSEALEDRNSSYLKISLLSHQIQQVLGLSELSGSAAEAWHKATIASLQDQYYKNFLKAPRGILLLQKGHMQKKLEKSLQKWFGVALRTVTQPISSLSVVNELNRWAENESNNKIKVFLEESSLKTKKSVMLSPAVIQSFWLHQFDTQKTYQKGLFYRTPNDRFEIPMMICRLKIPLGYSPALEARVLELSFQVRRASLFIILPDHMEQALSTLESNVTSENIRSLLSTLKTEVVNLRLPRFYVDSALSLVKPLQNLGMTEMFNNQDQHQKMDQTEFYFPPDDFIHRVRFEVREKNEYRTTQSEASQQNLATSAPSFDETIGKFDEKYFEVDHPFIFFIWDYIASTIICMGRVVDPGVLTLES